MNLIAKPYRPSGSWWSRTKHALFTFYVSLHLRAEERRKARIALDHFVEDIGKLGDVEV